MYIYIYIWREKEKGMNLRPYAIAPLIKNIEIIVNIVVIIIVIMFFLYFFIPVKDIYL